MMVHPDARDDFLRRLHGAEMPLTGLEYFDELLGAPRLDVVEDLYAEGMLRHATVVERLNAATVAMLKTALVAHGRATKGKKADLIAEALATLPQEVLERLAGPLRLVHTEAGAERVARYRARRLSEFEAARRDVATALDRRDLDLATERSRAYIAGQLFPPGIGIDWTRSHPGRRHAEILLGWGEIDLAVYALIGSPPWRSTAPDSPAWKRSLIVRQLDQMLESRRILGGSSRGFTILPGNPCDVCKERDITWRQYDAGNVALPPFHEGCACCLAPLLD